jgi:peptidoglycan/LPS O-acetylase OafA/YrhL
MKESLLRLIRGPIRDLAHRPAGQIPALDALRTCAVTLVVCAHAGGAYVTKSGSEDGFCRLPLVRGGWIGVDLFFVLSGYFIGKQLWRELEATGTIAFGRFVLRRGFRIWPLYAFFLVFVVAVLGEGDFPLGRWWSDAVFLTNYVHQGVVRGSWSLCTEEQFYTLAPLMLIIGTSRINSVAGFRPYLLGMLVLLPAIRAVSWWYLAGSLSRHDPILFLGTLYMPIHSHSDGLIMGLLIANLELTGVGQGGRVFFASGWCVLAALVACAGFQKLQREVFNFTGITLLFGAIVWFLLSRRRSWLSWLDAIPFYWISRLSYGIYLNHPYFVDHVVDFSRAYIPLADRYPALHDAATAGIVMALSTALSFVTFCLVEYPFLQLRRYMMRGEGTRSHVAPQKEWGDATPGWPSPRHGPTPVALDGVRGGSGPLEG